MTTPPRPLPRVSRQDPLPPPGPGDAPHVWLARTPDDEVDADRAGVLDAGEAATAKGFRSGSDRRTYVEVHVGLRVLLGAYLGMSPRSVPLVRRPCVRCGEPHGRPAVEGNPIHFSLSHTDGLGLLAFAASPVGVDVEKVPTPDTVAEIAPSLHPRETQELAAWPLPDRPRAFARTWARKEAYLKGIGTGLSRGLALDYLGPTEPCAARLPGWHITDIPVGPTYVAAVALAVRS